MEESVSKCAENKVKAPVKLTKDFEEIKGAILAVAENGKMSCTTARKVAEDLSVQPAEVGQVADEIKVKVFGCELGCF